MNAYIKTQRSQINDVILHLKCLEKQEQAKLNTSRREIKIRVEINEIEMKKKNPYKQSTKQSVGSLK
jgi:hypothetical protein